MKWGLKLQGSLDRLEKRYCCCEKDLPSISAWTMSPPEQPKPRKPRPKESCPECGSTKGKNVYNHLFFVHNYTKDEIERVKIERAQQRVASRSKNYLCECGRVYGNYYHLLKHKREKHEGIVHEARLYVTCPLCSHQVRVRPDDLSWNCFNFFLGYTGRAKKILANFF